MAQVSKGRCGCDACPLPEPEERQRWHDNLRLALQRCRCAVALHAWATHIVAPALPSLSPHGRRLECLSLCFIEALAADAYVTQPADRALSVAVSLLLPVLSKPLLADLALLSSRGAARGGPPAVNALALQGIVACALCGQRIIKMQLLQPLQARQWGMPHAHVESSPCPVVVVGRFPQHAQPAPTSW